MSNSQFSPKAQIELSNRRVTWVAWKLLTWMLPRKYIPYQMLMDYLVSIPHVGSKGDAVNTLRYMARLTVVDSRSRGNNVSYYLTDYGYGLLKAFNERNPPEPAEADALPDEEPTNES